MEYTPQTSLMLVWEDGRPRFRCLQELGDFLELHFGLAQEDEAYAVPAVSYYLTLAMHAGAWSADLTEQVEKERDQWDEIRAMAAALTAALNAGQDFNLSPFIARFGALDARFRFGISARHDPDFRKRPGWGR